MTTQPEALRLADLLCKDGHECCDFQAAAELRRLHAENERLQERRDAVMLSTVLEMAREAVATLQAEIDKAGGLK